jgi:hypothetical protein
MHFDVPHVGLATALAKRRGRFKGCSPKQRLWRLVDAGTAAFCASTATSQNKFSDAPLAD